MFSQAILIPLEMKFVRDSWIVNSRGFACLFDVITQHENLRRRLLSEVFDNSGQPHHSIQKLAKSRKLKHIQDSNFTIFHL